MTRKQLSWRALTSFVFLVCLWSFSTQEWWSFSEESGPLLVPGVRKAVRWNTPFYGMDGRGWFLAFHCITKYVKVSFLNGASLRPPPPVESKHPSTRYLHIHEDDEIDEKRIAQWVRQASALPGDECFP